MHAVADRHDTGPMMPDALRATDITSQRQPSHTRGFGPPVSTQNRGDVHDTAPGKWTELARTLNLHRDPFQIPTNDRPAGRDEPLPNTTDPVAAQK
jgi:hypothetical protein